jgi:hypothetical protein
MDEGTWRTAALHRLTQQEKVARLRPTANENRYDKIIDPGRRQEPTVLPEKIALATSSVSRYTMYLELSQSVLIGASIPVRRYALSAGAGCAEKIDPYRIPEQAGCEHVGFPAHRRLTFQLWAKRL